MHRKLTFLFIILTSLISIRQVFTQSIDGAWKGSIGIMGQELDIMVNLETGPDSIRGTIDIPPQNAKDLKLIHISFSSPKVYFELPAGPGLAVFDGELQGDSITGKFTQSGLEGTFRILRTEEGFIEEKLNGIDHVPYKQEEVTFTNGDIKLAGTLTIPYEKGKHPAVVLITGSGPQNRDEELFGFKPFGIIADYLTRHGVAVLRYDDRGVGGSTGQSVDNYTTADLASDVMEAVKYLKTRSDINPGQIGLIGHSEGGIIAPMVASKSKDIAFIVLMAGTGVKGIDVLQEQTKKIILANGGTDKDVKENRTILNMIYAASTAGYGWDRVADTLKKSMLESYDKMTEEQKKSIKDKDEFIKTMTEIQIKKYKSAWMKYFIDYDPIPALKKVSCPVLLLFAELDLQVPPSQNRKPMEEALKKGVCPEFQTVLFIKANHLFETAITGSPEEYSTLPKEFANGFLNSITKWILARVTVVK
jgi:pimeloyl-ACP methyl ester carboxylesterase